MNDRRERGSRSASTRPVVAIVGGGVSGGMLAIQLLRRATLPLDIVVIEPRAVVGRGVAYSTTNPAHLLNVRAGNMSAFEREPDHFLRWLDARVPAPADHWRADSFAPRALFGRYVVDVLRKSRIAAPEVRIRHARTQAVAIAERDRRMVVRLADGRNLLVDRVALCPGNFPPAPPRNLSPVMHAAGFLHDPWDWPALGAIGTDDPVLLLGTGLTMVDVLLELDALGHRGPVLAISRHGLLPRAHAPSRPCPAIADAVTAARGAGTLLRIIRAAAARAEATGDGWRGVIDGLRPHTQALWRQLEPAERQRFLRHLQPWWDVHRHRMAPQVAARIGQLERDGRLTVAAGRIATIADAAGALTGTWSPRGTTARKPFRVCWVVNCTGPVCDYSRIRDPLIRHLLNLGRARPDSLHLGLDVAVDGSVIDHAGTPSDRLFALGPPTRGMFWEITAVPDIRKAAERLAARMLAPWPEASNSAAALEDIAAGLGPGERRTASLLSSGL
jgi:uncharacterized NAD(P)/FAD-binding protein YdhS